MSLRAILTFEASPNHKLTISKYRQQIFQRIAFSCINDVVITQSFSVSSPLETQTTEEEIAEDDVTSDGTDEANATWNLVMYCFSINILL